MIRWRRPRFSIRALLALVLAAGVALAAWVVPYREYRRQIAEAPKVVTFKGQIACFFPQEMPWETRRCWQAWLIGDDTTGPVTTLRCFVGTDGEQLARVAGFRDLETLELADAIDPKGDGLAPLAGLPALRELSIGGHGWRDSDLAVLKDLPRLERLKLGDIDVSAAGLAQLGDLTRLRELDLYAGEPTDAELAFLGRMKGLRSLSLAAWPATDAVLDTIRTLPDLERLELDGVPIADDHLGRLVGLDRLERLVIHRSNLDGRGLAVLSRLPRLRELILWSNGALRDDQLDQLRHVTQLRSICLIHNDSLTEAGLGALKGLTHLECLKIATESSSAWSDEAVAQLKKALPGTRIDVEYRRPDGTAGALSTTFEGPDY